MCRLSPWDGTVSVLELELQAAEIVRCGEASSLTPVVNKLDNEMTRF